MLQYLLMPLTFPSHNIGKFKLKVHLAVNDTGLIIFIYKTTKYYTT